MTLIELSALVQSGVLSAITIVICIRSPAIWRAYLDYVDASRKFEAEQRLHERQFRHELGDKVTKALAELTVVVHDLREVVAGMCKFKP